MEITKLLESINSCKKLPAKEINALIERKEESLSILLKLIQSLAVDYKRIKLDRLDYIVACYILSQWREKRAFPYLVKLASIPSNWVDRVWDDVADNDLARFLVSTFDGNMQALKGLIENEAADSYCRRVALEVLVGLVAEEVFSREEILDYFKILMKSDLMYDYEFSASVIDSAYRLYPQEVYKEIVDLFERNLVDTWYVSKQEVEEVIAMGKEECLKTYLYGDENHLPINNALEALSAWLDFESMEALQNLPCIQNNFKNFKNEHNKSCC